MSESTTTRAVNLPDHIWQRVQIVAAGRGLTLDDAMAEMLSIAIRTLYAPIPVTVVPQGETPYERNQRELRDAGFDAYTSDEIDEFPNMNRR